MYEGRVKIVDYYLAYGHAPGDLEENIRERLLCEGWTLLGETFVSHGGTLFQAMVKLQEIPNKDQ